MSGLSVHLSSGATTVARAWDITRRDGVVLGFTDHDCDLAFNGIDYVASDGLTARALERGAGLAVDNTEVAGVLSDQRITETDLDAGRFDGAQVRMWLVNWTDVEDRQMRFRGSIGEITRSGGSFTADLRGLKQALNQPRGRAFQRSCGAILGDQRCGFDLSLPGYSADVTVGSLREGWIDIQGAEGITAGWLSHGYATVLDGAANGLGAPIRADRMTGSSREVSLWSVPAGLGSGDRLRVLVGCDKSFGTCRERFGNQINFRGFPDIPGDDWLMRPPVVSGNLTGGSRR